MRSLCVVLLIAVCNGSRMSRKVFGGVFSSGIFPWQPSPAAMVAYKTAVVAKRIPKATFKAALEFSMVLRCLLLYVERYLLIACRRISTGIRIDHRHYDAR